MFKLLGIEKDDTLTWLKFAIWLYFILLIFEGALRKWILPGLSGPLLLIRDPVAIYIIFAAIKKRKFPANPFILIVGFISVISFISTFLMGHGNVLVALYGLRILLIHFPLVFIIGNVFKRNDVLRVGQATLWITIPMTILIALQFYSPQSAFVNQGVGGDESGAGFRGALGFYRPPGTFSFTNGNTLFYSFAAPFIFYFITNLNQSKKLLVFASIIALMAAIPLSISRSLFFQVAITILFLILGASRKPRYLARLFTGALIVLFSLAILSQTSFFKTGTTAFTSRFESANKSEGGIESVFLDRFLGGLIASFTNTSDLPFFGAGLGLGTNVASVLLSGERKFLIAEGEWARIIGEMGLLLGLILILVRVFLSVRILIESYRKLVKGDMFPWLLSSFGFIVVAQGLWAQPTALGFSTIMGGLMLASLNESKSVVQKTVKQTRR